MLIKIGRRTEEWTEVGNILVKIGESEFTLSVNNQGELVVNKNAIDGDLILRPHAINEIGIK